jgi:hypothetical protein
VTECIQRRRFLLAGGSLGAYVLMAGYGGRGLFAAAPFDPGESSGATLWITVDSLSITVDSVFYRSGSVDADSDGDSILDSVEGRGLMLPVDTDVDGTPDYLDTDSDNDGAGDQFELGPDAGNPYDLNSNGVADYLDAGSTIISDMNSDGRFDVIDVLLIGRFLAGLTALDPNQQYLADVYPVNGGDGVVNISDWLLLQQMLLTP